MNSAVTTSKTDWLTYICKACGLLYKEEDGDPDSGLAPGTRFEDIPEDWFCPLCGVTKMDFVLHVVVDKKQFIKNQGSDQINFSRTNFSDVLIIGAGKAGWEVAKAIRALSDDLSISIVTGCNGELYEKPQLSNALLKKIQMDRMVLQTGEQAAKQLGVKLFPSTHAVHISHHNQQLRTTKGVFKYKYLVIAHGAKPIRHPVLSAQDCWHVNHLSTYRELRKTLDGKKSQIAIIGAGLIGCELANDLALAGHEIALLDASLRPLAHLIPEAASEALMKSWQALNIQFHGEQQIEKMSHQDNKKVLSMQSGLTLKVDEIVLCMGLQPDSSLAKSAGLEWHQGISVDPQTLKTNVENIFALGDCISVDGKVSRYIEPILRQAQVIANHIAGDQSILFTSNSLPIRIKTSSLPMRLEGVIERQGEWRISKAKAEQLNSKWQMTQWSKNQVSALLDLG
jgi:rubredoxin-NAD+ reductase